MATVLTIGPADRGRPMTLDEFMGGDYLEGYQYELIDGRLYVSPLPDLPQNRMDEWLYFKVKSYSALRPEIVNYVTNKARVFVPGRPGVTNPEPDLSAYHDFPLDKDLRSVRWQDVSPVLVGEIVSVDDPDKDLVRNVKLYLQVPSIKEYWVLDNRDDPNCPEMTVYRRFGARWRTQLVRFGETYTTKLLPGFTLVLDPRK